MGLWRNSTPFFGAAPFCTTKIDDFMAPLKSVPSPSLHNLRCACLGYKQLLALGILSSKPIHFLVARLPVILLPWIWTVYFIISSLLLIKSQQNLIDNLKYENYPNLWV